MGQDDPLEGDGAHALGAAAYAAKAAGLAAPDRPDAVGDFTEAGGRIYGLTTDSPLEFADRMSTEAEHYIEMLRTKAEPIDNK